MEKYRYTFNRKVDPGFEEEDFDLKRRGTRTFRLKTGANQDFFSRAKTDRRDRFNEQFIGRFNEATGHELDHRNPYVKRELRRIHSELERGDDQIHFEVTSRMQ